MIDYTIEGLQSRLLVAQDNNAALTGVIQSIANSLGTNNLQEISVKACEEIAIANAVRELKGMQDSPSQDVISSLPRTHADD